MAMSMCVVLVSLVAFVDSNDNTDQVQMAMNLSMGNEKHHRSTHAQLNHPIADGEPQPDFAKKYDWRYLECWGVCGGAKQCNACNSKSEVESTQTNGVVRGGCCSLDHNGNHVGNDPEVCKKVPKHRFKYALNTGTNNDGKALNPTDRYHMCVLVDMQCDDTAHGFVNHGADIKKECPQGDQNCKANPFAKSCPNDKPIVNNYNFCFGQNCNVVNDRARCCRANTCTCKDGTAKSANDADDANKCKTDKANDCLSCKKGYHLEQGADGQHCKPNKCECSNGDPTSGTGQEPKYFCKENGKIDCSKCDPGYHSDAAEGIDHFGAGEQKCVENKCTCPGNYGGPATGTACTTHGGKACTTCKDGYEKQNGKLICEPSQCQQQDWAKLYPAADFSLCSGLRTKETCSVTCAKGYSGSTETWTCGKDEKITGTNVECEGETCEDKTSDVFTNALVLYGSCKGKKTGESCNVQCKSGYTAFDDKGKHLKDNKARLDCTKDGWTGSINCQPNPCSAMAKDNIKNGGPGSGPGSCGSESTIAGQYCQINCNAGYIPEGATKCTAGTFSPVAKCVEEVCAGPTPPKYGFKNKGNCEATLDHGAKCKFECIAGYEATESSCDKGTLTPGTCKPKLDCKLIWTRWCSDMYGYWTNAAQNLDYAGCEAWCNSMNDDSNGQKIFGCELAEVPAKGRASKGKWCFAHELCTTLQFNKDKYAANKCTAYGASSKKPNNVELSPAKEVVAKGDSSMLNSLDDETKEGEDKAFFAL